jgi:SAM-dependent methyltransferase
MMETSKMETVRFKLPPRGLLTENNQFDPFRYYYKPVVGRVFAARFDVGLSLIDARFRRLLEVGYGSGLLMPTLAGVTDELWGIDLEREPPGLRGALARLGVQPAQLLQANLCELPLPDGHFDGVVAFSILEHLEPRDQARAASEVARVLAPGGRFLVGCPAVHKAMNAMFGVIGFHGIEDHHKSSLRDVLAACEPLFTVEKRASLPRLMDHAPVGWAPYGTVLLRKR